MANYYCPRCDTHHGDSPRELEACKRDVIAQVSWERENEREAQASQGIEVSQ